MSAPRCVDAFYEAFTRGAPWLLDDALVDDWQEHPPSRPDQGAGRDGFKPLVSGLRAALPDLRFEVEDTVWEGDRVAVRSTIRGRTRAGEPVAAAAFDVHRLRDGLIAETWHLEDRATLQAAIGAQDRNSSAADTGARPTRVLVVYATTQGNTRDLANAVVDGASSVPGVTVVVREATAATLDDARVCDALILGSPVRHRTADARVKRFVEDVCERLWLTDEMVGKVGATFTVGGGYGDAGAGCELAQLGMLAAMAANGMVLVTLPKTTPGFARAGMHWGVHGRSGGSDMTPQPLADDMLSCARHHGANVARVAQALRHRQLLAEGNVAPPRDVAQQIMAGPVPTA